MNDKQLIVTPNNFTELYAVKQFILQNGELPIGEIIQVDEESVCQNENV